MSADLADEWPDRLRHLARVLDQAATGWHGASAPTRRAFARVVEDFERDLRAIGAVRR